MSIGNDLRAPVMGAGAPDGAAKTVTTASFRQDVIAESMRQPVLVDFWAPWCGPCRLIEPLLNEIEKEATELKIVKTDADSNPALVEKYKVSLSWLLALLRIQRDFVIVEPAR